MIDFSEKIYSDPDYRHYIAQYYGDILSEASQISDYYIKVINNKYAIISLKKNISYEELRVSKIKGIIYIEKANLFSLESVDPVTAAGINQMQKIEALNLTGKGVLVGMVDTGINYLNKELWDENGNCRVETIWDQTIINDKKNTKEGVEVPFGTVYSKDEIDNAVKSYKEGGDPYKVVPSKDDIGHGTKMSVIIGGAGTNLTVKGGAPNCNFISVKLQEDLGFKEELNVKDPVYNLISVFSAVDFLIKYADKENKPMVIYLPLGNSFSNHKGDTLLERFIDDASINRGVIVVTSTGNEGDRQNHTSGTIKNTGGSKDIMLYIDPMQKNIAVQLWVARPNVMSINIISPSGEESGIVPAILNFYEDSKFIFENTKVSVTYYIPEPNSGDELVELYFRNAQAGTWKIRLIGDYILDGRFDAWLPQAGLTFGKTQFIYSDPYGTLTYPGPSRYIINVGNYDQTTNYVINSSGRAFEEHAENTIDVVAGGVNVMTTNIEGNGYSIVNGTSVSAAVVAGACALLLQWSIVDKNSRFMYSQKIRVLMIRGVIRRQGDIYPNEEFGYGIFNMVEVFRNIT